MKGAYKKKSIREHATRLPSPALFLTVPEWLKKQMDKVETSCGGLLTNLNHVLVNEYQPGQGIMAHQDGPLYTPAVAILSLVRPIPRK